MTQIRITFITPLFSRGAYEHKPEIRPSSIRGQLHWWLRAIGGSAAEEREIFGSVHLTAKASKIVVRVSDIKGSTQECYTLPHKTDRPAPRHAFQPGTSFTLLISERLGGLDTTHRALFDNTLHAWLLMGSLGLRSTRGAGSFVWTCENNDFAYPNSLEQYAQKCKILLDETKSKLRIAILNKEFSDPEAARKCVSDTIGGLNDRSGDDSLRDLHFPLGKGGRERKTSPLRFRIIKIRSEKPQYYICAIWDGRTEITGNTFQDLKKAIELLKKRNKEIGGLLANSELASL